MMPSGVILLIAGVFLVVFTTGGLAARLDSLDGNSVDSSPVSSSSKEEAVPSSLVKRSAPASSSAYGHSIMRFGRAPHNIMHFGKRSEAMDAVEQPMQAVGGEGASSLEAASLESVPEWVLRNALAGATGGSAVPAGHVTRYLIVPVSVPVSSSSSGGYARSAPAKKARLNEESDNVFMHFG